MRKDFLDMAYPLVAVTADHDGKNLHAEIADGLRKMPAGRELLAAFLFDPRLSTESVASEVTGLNTKLEQEPTLQMQWTRIFESQRELQRKSECFDRIEEFLDYMLTDRHTAKLEESKFLQDFIPACLENSEWLIDRVRDYEDEWNSDFGGTLGYYGIEQDTRNIVGGFLQKSWEADQAWTEQVLEQSFPDLIEHPERYENLGVFAAGGLKELKCRAQNCRQTVRRAGRGR